jgi:hypothetical protein
MIFEISFAISISNGVFESEKNIIVKFVDRCKIIKCVLKYIWNVSFHQIPIFHANSNYITIILVICDNWKISL